MSILTPPSTLTRAILSLTLAGLLIFPVLTPPMPSLAAVGTNPASGNPLDYGGAGDWLGSGDPDQLTNETGATVSGSVYGNPNTAATGYSGGENTIINSGTVTGFIYGSDNEGNGTSGGGNTITNSGMVSISILGSGNSGDNASGGGNTITNTGTVTNIIFGTYNNGTNCGGGSNTIINYGSAGGLYGSSGIGAGGGSNTINNSGTVTHYIFGSLNYSDNSSGGSNTITNYGTVNRYIYGSNNISTGSSGGSNTITNTGTVGDDICGSYNAASGSSGGGNTITNSGTVGSGIYGTFNSADSTTGGDNTINNSGTVTGDIYGTCNLGIGASSGGSGNTITNSGTVGGGIYAGDADDTVYLLSGSSVGGVVDGQAGTDTLYFGVSGVTDSSSFSSGSYLNFENLGLYVDGDTTLTGNWNLNMGVTVTSTGTLTLNSTLSATTLNNAGTSTFNGDASFSGAVDNSGTLSSSGDFTAASLTNSGTATFNGDTDISGAVDNSGGLTVGSVGTLSAGSVNNSDSLAVDGTLTADSLTNSGGMAIGGSVDVGTLNNDGGGLGVAGSLTADTLINSGGVGIGGTVTVGSLTNSGAIGVGTTLTAGSVNNSGNLAVGGTLSAGTVSNSGNLAVGGSMTVVSLTNSGNLPVGGTLSAGTVSNSGFLPVGGAMTAGSVNNSGTLNVNGSLGTASLTNSGDLTVTNGGSLNAGSLTNSGSATVSGRATVGSLANNGSLNVSGSLAAGTFNNGSSAIISGTAIVSGAAANSGSLNVNGSLTAASLNNSGTLSGSGTIHSEITNTGTISPGNSIGTLLVASSLTFESGSVLAAELASDLSCDVIAVSGAVTINGGTISTYLPHALYADGTCWNIITANGGISGLFDDLIGQPDSEVLSLTQQNTGDSLSLVINRKSYGDFASGGAAATGRGLDALVPLADGDMAMMLMAMDYNMDATQIANIVEALNPEMYTAFSAASLKAGGLFDGAMDRRLEELRQRRALSLDQRQALSGLVQVASAETVPLSGVEQTTGTGWSLWGRGIGLWADQDAADGYLGRGQTTGGAALGADYVINHWLVLGLATGATRTDISWSRGNYDGDIDALHTGLYAQAGYEGFFARLLASYARLQNSATRPMDLEGYNVTARADFDADLYAAGMAVGYQARYEQWLLEPLASLDYQHLKEEGFSEGGAGFLDLDVADRDTDSLLFNLGIRATRLIQAGDWEMLPRLGIAWQHQLGDDRPSIDASFAGYGSAPFTVNGADFISDVAVAELGLTASVKSGLELFIDYRLSYADDYLAQVLGAGLMYSF